MIHVSGQYLFIRCTVDTETKAAGKTPVAIDTTANVLDGDDLDMSATPLNGCSEVNS